MAAIDLLRLRQQVARLSEFFFLPDEFVHQLHEVLEGYLNRTRRRALNVAPTTLTSYYTPPAVMRAIEQALSDLAASYPTYALELADRLWEEEVLEMRQLAAFLLGRIPPQVEPLLARVTAWSKQVRDEPLRAKLLDFSLARLRQESPLHFLTLIGEWLHPQRPRLWAEGLQALIPLLQDERFENLPPVFTLLRPVLEAAPATLQPEIAAVLRLLFQRAPQETVFTFRRWLEENPNTELLRGLRRTFFSLSPPAQELLRGLLTQVRV